MKKVHIYTFIKAINVTHIYSKGHCLLDGTSSALIFAHVIKVFGAENDKWVSEHFIICQVPQGRVPSSLL